MTARVRSLFRQAPLSVVSVARAALTIGFRAHPFGAHRRILGEHMAQSYRPLLRIGEIAIPVGWVILLVSTDLHPGDQDPDDFVAAFAEYAASSWIAVHAGQLLGYVLLIGGLIAPFSTVGERSSGPGRWSTTSAAGRGTQSDRRGSEVRGVGQGGLRRPRSLVTVAEPAASGLIWLG